MKRIAASLLIALTCVFSPCGAAAKSFVSAMPSYITADHLDYSKGRDVVIAKGNVEVHHEGRIIIGDFARLDNITGDGVIEGNVLIIDEEDYIMCRKATFNLKNNKGVIYDGAGIMASNYYFNGREIERITEDRYTILDGDITTCCDKVSPWKISASKIDVQSEQYAFLTHSLFRVKDVPVFYLPYFVFPVKTTRQTGLLTPGVGGGGKDGYTVTNTLFLAISESQDATIIWERKDLRGDRFDLEYRYVLSRKGGGTFNGTYFEDRDPETQKDTIFWKALYDHAHQMPYGVNGVVHIDQMSESSIDREFEYKDLAARTRRQTDSHVRINKNWSTRYLQLLARRRDSTETDYRERYEELPELAFTNQSEQISSTPLYFSLESKFKGFRREWESGTSPEEKVEVNRTDVYPKLSLPIPLVPWFSLTPSAAWRETYYSTGTDDQGFYREFYELGLETSGPKFYRIFQSEDIAVKHLIEPSLSYSHRSAIDKDVKNQILKFDDIDKLGTVGEPDNSVTFALTNRFLKKIGDDSASEVARLTLSENYNIQVAKRGDVDGTPNRPFSDLRIALETKVIPYLEFNYYNSFNVYEKISFKETMQVDLNVPEKGYVTVERRLERKIEDNRVFYDPEKITDIGAVGINLFNTVKFEMGRLYDELEHVFIEDNYSLTFSFDCWEISYEHVDRRWKPNDGITENRYETKFFVTVTLKDLATIGEEHTLGFIKGRF